MDADVDFKTAKNFVKTVKEQALGREVLTSIQPGQLLIKITHEELTKLMGQAAAPMELKGKPATILLAGLQGAGKTTHAGKLAARIAKSGRKPLLIACDVHRPAAVDQLHVVGENVGADVYSEPGVKDAVGIAQRGMAKAKAEGYGAAIVDTAGRLAIDEVLMEEISSVRDVVQPDEILFVVDAMTGQDAVQTAKAFNDRLDFSGVILTKLDGDARGGAALASIPWSASPSNLWAPVKRWMPWTSSPSGWRSHFGQRRCGLLVERAQRPLMRRGPNASKPSFAKTPSTSTISLPRFNKSKRWATSRTSSAWSLAWAKHSRASMWMTMRLWVSRASFNR